jgi:DNA-damage-inducible protein J
MPKTTFSVRMDSSVKQEFDHFCAKVGLTTTTAINLFARSVISEQRLPFEIELKKPVRKRRTLEEVFQDWSGNAPESYDWGEMDAPAGRELL